MKPQIPDVIDRFKAYHEEHLAWGSLHIVLEDENVQDSHVQFCIKCAKEEGDKEGDKEGVELGEILLQMSKRQRIKLGTAA